MSPIKLDQEILARIRKLPQNKRDQYLAFLKRKGIVTDGIDFDVVQTKKFDHSADSSELYSAKEMNGISRTKASSFQEQLWSIDQIQGGSNEYNICFNLSLQGNVRPELLTEAFQSVVNAQDILRTTYIFTDQTLWQNISDRAVFSINYLDITSIDKPAREHNLLEIVKTASEHVFDLGRDIPMIVTLVKTDENVYVLILVIHHIAADAESINILIRQVGTIYTGLATQESIYIAPARSSYGAFSAWQQSFLSSKDGLEGVTHWKKQLEGVPLLHSLPTESARPPIFTHQICLFEDFLEVNTETLVVKKSKALGVSTFTFLQAVFSIVVNIYSRDEKTCVGSPVSWRIPKNHADVIGNFTDTRLYYADFSKLHSLGEVINFFGQYMKSAVRYRTPLSAIASAINPKRSLSFNPLFQIMFIYTEEEEKKVTSLTLPEVSISVGEVPICTARYDIAMNLSKMSNGYRIGWEYETALFKPDIISAMSRCFKFVLRHACFDTELPVSDLKLDWFLEEYGRLYPSQPDQRSNVVIDLNTNDKGRCIHDIIAAQALRTPGQVAVFQEECSLSYSQLDQRSSIIAEHLRKVRVGCGHLVGLFFDNSAEAIIAMLAVLKSGAAYVPLDKSYPVERTRYIIGEAELSTLLTCQSDVEKLTGYTECLTLSPTSKRSVHIIAIDTLDIVNGSNLREPYKANKQVSQVDLAYVIYTSGSTGVPQGVRVSHANLLASTSARINFYSTPPASFLLLSSIAFDSSIAGIYWTLCTGGELVIPKDIRIQGLKYLNNLIEQRRVTHLLCLPSLYNYIIDLFSISNPLQTVILAGEACPVTVVAKHNQAANTNSVRLFNEYGPTESTVWSTVFEIPRSFKGKVVPIGKTVEHVYARVLDAYGNLVPIGGVGELCLGGTGVVDGYLNNDEQTHVKFVYWPGPQSLPERLFKTGDIVRFCFDGNYEFIERNDRQVKLRGFRIDLAEVELNLQSLSQIGQVRVVSRTSKEGNTLLIAFCVTSLSTSELESVVKNHVCKKLPSFMHPHSLVKLDQLPLTPNGKVDYQALELLSDAKSVLQKPPSAVDDKLMSKVSDGTEQKLIELFCQTLGMDVCDRSDNFFSLGGNSLNLIFLMHKINSIFGVEIDISTVLHEPTPEAISLQIHIAVGKLSNGSAITRIGIFSSGESRLRKPKIVAASSVSKDKPSRAPLSYSQRRLWSIAQIYPNNTLYNVPIRLRIKGHIDLVSLKSSLEEVVSRHQILRTVYAEQDGVPYQHVLNSYEVPLSFVDLRANLNDLDSSLNGAIETPFDLEHGPLLKVWLYNVGQDQTGLSDGDVGQKEHVMLLLTHHIASDAWSAQLLLREFSQIYNAALHHENTDLPKLRIQYADYANWQIKFLLDDEVKSDILYWRKKLEGVPPIHNLPLDYCRPPQQRFRGETLVYSIAPPVCIALRELAKQQGVTLFTLLLSVYCVLLSRWSVSNDIVIGTPVANRLQGDTESLIGFFINTLVLRVRASSDMPFRSLLEQVKQTMLEAFARQHVPVEIIMEALKTERSLSHNPLFQLVFSFDTEHTFALDSSIETSSTVPKPSIRSETVKRSVAKFDLSLNLQESSDGLVAAWEFNTDLFQPETVNHLAQCYEQLLKSTIADFDAEVSTLPILARPQLEILREWSRPLVTKKYTRYLHEGFQRQVKRSPGAIALMSRGRQPLSFDTLNQRVNQLANYLLACGFKPEQRVVVLLYKSFEAVTAILAVLKLGGTYVSIDPDYPSSRISYVMNDSKAQWLLSARKLIIDPQQLSDDVNVIILDEKKTCDLISDCDTGNISVQRASESSKSIAYILYTSGSTGRPKGVEVSQKAISQHIETVSELYEVDDCQRFLQFASLSFDASLEQLFIPLLTGKCNYLFDPSREDLLDVICAQSIHAVNLTPSYFAQYSERLGSYASSLELKWLNFGGEKLSRDLLLTCQKYSISKSIINTFGPTECVVTTHYCKGLELAQFLDIHYEPPIGRLIGDRRQYVVDERGQLAPPGAIGELCIAADACGSGLANGYFNNDELTRKSFIQNSFDTDTGLLYKTGDLVRFLAGGNLQYMGRGDRQVKIRGYRIECGEIENCICQLDSVVDAIVIEVEQQLVAYIVFVKSVLQELPNDLILIDRVRAHILEQLPRFELPSAFLGVDAIPFDTNGKLDLNCLPRPNFSTQAIASYLAPKTETEITLCAIWQSLLDLERVGLHDNFFNLGGHSLIGTRLVAHIKTRWPIDIALATIFDQQTPIELANFIDAELSLNAALPKDSIESNKSALVEREHVHADDTLQSPNEDVWEL